MSIVERAAYKSQIPRATVLTPVFKDFAFSLAMAVFGQVAFRVILKYDVTEGGTAWADNRAI